MNKNIRIYIYNIYIYSTEHSLQAQGHIHIHIYFAAVSIIYSCCAAVSAVFFIIGGVFVVCLYFCIYNLYVYVYSTCAPALRYCPVYKTG